jgi:hypothetical protein
LVPNWWGDKRYNKMRWKNDFINCTAKNW